ncbi:class I SAM-dependent methyltransferase [Desulfonatronum thioautotrophicum]|uniref:class I SAM-dependent methyltransferase n=1 Tax=Desulfonatronum thioautotrophicum TaxID=617001 RepID=UPI000A05A1DD|nr:methyltransferase [Desulfonatronum thioautotrophicum]
MTKSDTGTQGKTSGPFHGQLLSRAVSQRELSQLLEEASLEQLLDLVSAKHPVHFETVRIGGDSLECLQLTDMEAFIDQQINLATVQTGIDALPLWAKIWPASLPLAMYLRSATPEPGERILEIGAGLGLTGLFAAKRGFSVVLSDLVPEALLFARINALRNDLGPLAQVRYLDFTRSDHTEQYDRIIGSEILYREVSFEPLLQFFRTALTPQPKAEILLSASAGRRSIKFFAAAKDFFQISRSAVSTPFTGGEPDGADQTTYLYRLRPL